MSLDISKLLTPRSVAVVGASPREGTTAYRVLNNLKRQGFTGSVFPVNPRYEEVLGLRCHPSLRDLPEPVDTVFVAIAAEHAVAVVEEAAACGIGGAIVNASGFADGGPEGEALQRRLAVAAEGIALCGPNNMGLMNIHDRVCLWTSRHVPKLRPGPVAVISQSGSVAIALSQDERGLGLSHVITAGNEAVCTVADYLQAVIRDDRVKVAMLFLETVRDPRLFAQAALEASRRGKRIVALKAGRSEGGRAAVAAHTGALSGEDEVYDAFFRRYGVVRAGDIDEMIETAMLLSRYPSPPPRREAIAITVSGGEAALIADLGADVGLRLATLSDSTLQAMRPAFPPFTRPRNPVDAWGLGWDVGRFRQILGALLREPGAGTIACAVDAPAAGGADAGLAGEMAAACIEALPRTDQKFVFLNNTSGGVNPELRDILDGAGIPYLCGMRPALAAIAHWAGAETPLPVAGIEARPMPDPRRLAEADRYRLLAEAGVPMADCVPVRSAAEAAAAAERLGYPVVVKGTAPAIAHKTEFGLVRLGLAGAEAVRRAFDEVSARLGEAAGADPLASVVVQPMVGGGLQMILGIRNDPRFGSITVVGLGGTLVEVLREASLRIGPVDPATARAMLAETKAAELLAGTRGQEPFDIEAAVSAIVALSRLGFAARDAYASIEVNPLIVRPHGLGAVGVDVVIEPADIDGDPSASDSPTEGTP